MGLEIVYPTLGFVRAELIINCIVVFITLPVVILRVLGRIFGPGLGLDDALVMFAMPLGVGMLICQGLFTQVGNGYTLSQHPDLVANVPYILQLTFGMQIVYVLLLGSVKASILFLYIRIFVTQYIQRAAKILLGIILVWGISYLCACIFICTPISAQWTGLGTCGAYIHMIQSLIATNAIGDLIIVVLPMHAIWKLQMPTIDKIGVASCFGICFICIVCAVFRFIYISVVDLTHNVTGTMPTTIFLFVLEPNLSILCVSIPMIRPFYSMYKERSSRTGGSRLHDHSPEHGTGFDSKSGSKAMKSSTRPDNIQVELNDYAIQKGTKHDAYAVGPGDDFGSEHNLTTEDKGAWIGVETKWNVTHT